MKKPFYVGLMVLCVASFAPASIAKGKPHHSPRSLQNQNQPSVQSNHQQEDDLLQDQLHPNDRSKNGSQGKSHKNVPYQPSNANLQPGFQSQNSPSSMPARSNKGGLVRGKDRARQVQNMNALKKKRHKLNKPEERLNLCTQSCQ